MKNFNSRRKIVYVHGEEAQLVQMAEQIHLAATKRAQEAAQPGTTSPMAFYETEMETGVLDRLQALVRQYQKAMNLDLPPILVPAGAQRPDPPPVDNNLIRVYRQASTDLEMAEIFINRVIVRRQGGNIYRFDGRIYRLLTADQFHTLILDTLRQELGINGSSKQIKSVAAAIMAEPRIEVKCEAVNASGICLRNGVLDLNTLQLRPHSPGCVFTWMMDVDWLGERLCPVCDRFFEFAAGGDPVLIQRFWEALAYVLLPDYNTKRFLVLKGKGDSGKSVWGATVESFFEETAVGSVDIFKFGDRFPIGTLAHKRVNISMDLSNSAMTEQAISVIKQITGRDLIVVEEKYKTPYATRIDCKLIFGTNHALRTNSHDTAFLRRVLYLPFHYPVPPNMQNPNLRQMLRAEKSEILFKALRAYRGLVTKGYFFSGDDIYDFTRAYQVGEEVTDPATVLEEFVAAHCGEQQDGFVTTDALYEAYQAYCRSLSHDSIRNKQVFSTKFNAIVQRIPNVTHYKKRVNGVSCNGYAGLALS